MGELINERVVMTHSITGFSLDFNDEWYYEGQTVELTTLEFGYFECALIEYVSTEKVVVLYNEKNYEINPSAILAIEKVVKRKIKA